MKTMQDPFSVSILHKICDFKGQITFKFTAHKTDLLNSFCKLYLKDNTY